MNTKTVLNPAGAAFRWVFWIETVLVPLAILLGVLGGVGPPWARCQLGHPQLPHL